MRSLTIARTCVLYLPVLAFVGLPAFVIAPTEKEDLDRSPQPATTAPVDARFRCQAPWNHSLQISEEKREELVTAIAKARNERGDLIARLQPGFAGYPAIGSEEALEQEIAKT